MNNRIKAMKTADYFKIVLITTLLILIGSGISTTVYADEGAKTVTLERAVYYDIWCNALGIWTSAGSPGSYVNFDCKENYSTDSGMRLTDVKVEIIKPEKSFIWYNMCVTAGTVKTLNFNSSGVSFSVGAFLIPSYAPVQLMRFVSPNLMFNGYRYYFKVRITLTYNGTSEGSHEISSPARHFTADADLFMPETAYQGHKTLLQDLSGFSHEKEFFTAYLFYKKGYGSNSYSLIKGPAEVDMRRLSEDSPSYYSDRIAYFNTPGEYSIRLSANVKDGMTSADTEDITVLPVPDIRGELKGIKTSLSKQELDITAALNPKVPWSKVEVDIRNSDGSEKVTLTCTPDGKSTSSGNTSNIKTREVEILSSDEEFAHLKTDFITKNKADEEYRITLTVYDRDNNSDKYTMTYTAKAPAETAVKAGGDKTVTRNQNSNTAVINLSDNTDTGGMPVERKWEFYDGKTWTEAFPYADTSLGTKKSITARVDGVGKKKFRLTIKNVYNEDNSLPEFINEEDRGGGTAVFETEVINVKPAVSFKSGSSGKANLVLLYEEEREAEALAEKEYLTSALAEKGISGTITLRKIIGNIGESNNYGDFHVISRPFSYRAQFYSYDGSNYICDSKRIYHLEATYGSYGGGASADEPEPSPPYYIKAFDIVTGEEMWTTVIDEDTFDPGRVFSVNQDDREDYLYISNEDSTLVINKDDGAVITKLSLPVGKIYKTENALFSVGTKYIHKISLSTGNSETLFSGNISGESEILKGLINFAVIEDNRLVRKTLDPETDVIRDFGKSFGSETSANLGFDSRGYMLVGNPSEGASITLDRGWASDVAELILYDENAEVIKQINTDEYNNGSYTFKNAAGEFAYSICGYNSEKTVKGKSYTENKNNYIAYSYGPETTYPTFNNSQRSSYMSTIRTLAGYITDEGFKFYTAANHGYAWDSDLTFNNSLFSCRFTYYVSGFSYKKGSGIASVYSTDYDTGFQGENSCCMQYTNGSPQKDGISGCAEAFAPYYKTAQTLVEYNLDKYLRDSPNEYSGVFIMSDSELKLTDTENNRFYSVDGSDELRASVNDFTNYLSSKQVGSADSMKLIYNKGETVNIIGDYFDYEGDPSGQSYYVYYHYPYNDGANPEVNYITDDNFNIIATQKNDALTSPINVFYHDGMYKVEHWQYDSTGEPDYDKMSNVASLIFFIRSDNTLSLPEVESINISPVAPRAGQAVNAEIKVSDSQSKELSVKVEIFRDEVKVGEYSFSNIRPDYPSFGFTAVEAAETGAYTLVCTVTDGKRQNIKSLRFTVLPGYTVSTTVSHTSQWETNRQRYNVFLFGSPGLEMSDYEAYSLRTAPRMRGQNVFWTEEKLYIKAGIEGSPVSVNAQIKGTLCTSVLSPAGETDSSGNSIYEGSLWSSGFKDVFGKECPVEVTVSVIAYYEDGTSAACENTVIFDDSDEYWRVHKLY